MAASWRFKFVFDERRRWRWVLCSAEDVIVADSASSFATRQEAEEAAAEVAENSASAAIDSEE